MIALAEVFALSLPATLVRASTVDTIDPSIYPSKTTNCVTFNSEERMITISCKTTNLTQIDNVLKNPEVIRKDVNTDRGWVLNAGITVAENAILYINSSDTSWLKILADGETAYPIYVSGALKIDSVKISSWNRNTNNWTATI